MKSGVKSGVKAAVFAVRDHSGPQLVHLRKVGENEFDGIANRAGTATLTRRVILKLRLLHRRSINDDLRDKRGRRKKTGEAITSEKENS